MRIRYSISGIIRIIITIITISIYSITFNYSTEATTQSDNLQQSTPVPNKVMDFVEQYPQKYDKNQGCQFILPTWATAAQSKNVDIVSANDHVPEWQDTGVNVDSTQELEIQILGVDKKKHKKLREYLVLFRFDPRLPDQGNSFIIDMNTPPTNNKGLSNASNNDDNFIAALQKYANIFSNTKTTTIGVQANDIINISLILPNESTEKMLEDISLIQDSNANENNYAPHIIYRDSLISKTNLPIYNTVLFFENKNIDISTLKPALVGIKRDVDLHQIEKCNHSNQVMDSNCFMDMGRGMVIKLDIEIVKEYSDQFIIDPTIYSRNIEQNKGVIGVYHIVAKNAGNLIFVPPDNKDKQFIDIPRINNQDYSISSIQNFHDYSDYEEQYIKKHQHASLKSLFGCYLMRVTIGSPDTINNTYNNDLEYIISDIPPDQSTSGIIINKEYVNISSKKGKLWIRHSSKIDNSISSTISLKVTIPNNKFIKYPIARTIGDNVYIPVNNVLRSTSELLFSNLVKNAEFQKLVYIIVTLYVMWSGVQFLTGMSQFTAYEAFIRIVKIIAVTGIFTNYSFTVYEYLFSIFNDGMHNIINSVVVNYDQHSSNNNPFYFLDVIINRYIDTNFFKLLLIELIHIHNGLFIVAVLIITSLYKFFGILLKAVIEIITSMITISILVSLGPLFIICLLFERTFQIFRKWLLATLANVLVAFLLIIFISVIDALMVNAIQASAPSTICWSEFFKIILHTDFSAIGISRVIDIPLASINFYNVVLETGGLFKGSSLSFGEVLSGALLLYYLSELSGSLLGQTSLFRKKNVNISKKSYIKDLVQEILN